MRHANRGIPQDMTGGEGGGRKTGVVCCGGAARTAANLFVKKE